MILVHRALPPFLVGAAVVVSMHDEEALLVSYENLTNVPSGNRLSGTSEAVIPVDSDSPDATIPVTALVNENGVGLLVIEWSRRRRVSSLLRWQHAMQSADPLRLSLNAVLQQVAVSAE